MKCFECGAEAEHQHHVVPKSMGGTKTIPLCSSCHAKVHDRESMSTGGLTKAALAHKKSSGAVYTAVTPFGYQAIEGRLVKVEQEAELVAEMRRQRTSGATLAGIAQSLNDRGIQGKSGGRWYASTVSNILNRAA